MLTNWSSQFEEIWLNLQQNNILADLPNVQYEQGQVLVDVYADTVIGLYIAFHKIDDISDRVSTIEQLEGYKEQIEHFFYGNAIPEEIPQRDLHEPIDFTTLSNELGYRAKLLENPMYPFTWDGFIHTLRDYSIMGIAALETLEIINNSIDAKKYLHSDINSQIVSSFTKLNIMLKRGYLVLHAPTELVH